MTALVYVYNNLSALDLRGHTNPRLTHKQAENRTLWGGGGRQLFKKCGYAALMKIIYSVNIFKLAIYRVNIFKLANTFKKEKSKSDI